MTSVPDPDHLTGRLLADDPGDTPIYDQLAAEMAHRDTEEDE